MIQTTNSHHHRFSEAAKSSQPAATMVTDSKDDWSIPCMANENEDLEPPPEELESMYQLLESGGMLELQWKCAGRRQPSPVAGSADANAEVTPEKETPTKNKDFDFMDEVAAPTMRVRAQNSTPKGSAKKKTANFAGVIDAMKKHGRLTTQPGAAAGSTPKESPGGGGS